MIYSLYDESFNKPFQSGFAEKLRFDGIGDPEVEKIKERGSIDYPNLMKLAVDYSDGVIQGSEKVNPDTIQYIKEKKVEFLPYQSDFDKSVEEIDAFYEKIDN